MRSLQALLNGILSVCAAASQTCTGASTNLAQDQCDAWGDFYDALAGDGWTHCQGTKSDPCSCQGNFGTDPTCSSDGTTVNTMCVTRRRRRRRSATAPPRRPRRRALPLPRPSADPQAPLAAPRISQSFVHQ